MTFDSYAVFLREVKGQVDQLQGSTVTSQITTLPNSVPMSPVWENTECYYYFRIIMILKFLLL